MMMITQTIKGISTLLLIKARKQIVEIFDDHGHGEGVVVWASLGIHMNIIIPRPVATGSWGAFAKKPTVSYLNLKGNKSIFTDGIKNSNCLVTRDP